MWRLRPVRPHHRQGFAIIIGLLLVTMMSLYLVVGTTQSMTELTVSNRFTALAQLVPLEEAPIDRALQEFQLLLINSNPNGLRVGTWQRTIYANQSLGAGIYTLDIDPLDTNPTSEFDYFVLKARAGIPTLTPGAGTQRSQTCVVMTESLGNFAYYSTAGTTKSGQPIWFMTGDKIEGGRFYTNELYLDGSPVFDASVFVTGGRTDRPGGQDENPQFRREPPVYHAPERTTPSVSDVRAASDHLAHDIVFRGDTTIKLISDSGKCGVVNPTAIWIYNANVYNDDHGQTSWADGKEEFCYTEWLGVDSYGPVISVGRNQEGSVTIQTDPAVLTEPLTIVSHNNVYIEGSSFAPYACDPSAADCRASLMAVAAGGNVEFTSDAHNIFAQGLYWAMYDKDQDVGGVVKTSKQLGLPMPGAKWTVVGGVLADYGTETWARNRYFKQDLRFANNGAFFPLITYRTTVTCHDGISAPDSN